MTYDKFMFLLRLKGHVTLNIKEDGWFSYDCCTWAYEGSYICMIINKNVIRIFGGPHGDTHYIGTRYLKDHWDEKVVVDNIKDKVLDDVQKIE